MADGDYVPPRRFVVDAETAARMEDRLANPRKPNDALRALWLAATDEERAELRESVCECGSLDKRCQCWNDD